MEDKFLKLMTKETTKITKRLEDDVKTLKTSQEFIFIF